MLSEETSSRYLAAYLASGDGGGNPVASPAYLVGGDLSTLGIDSVRKVNKFFRGMMQRVLFSAGDGKTGSFSIDLQK